MFKRSSLHGLITVINILISVHVLLILHNS